MGSLYCRNRSRSRGRACRLLWLYAHDGDSSIHVIGPLFLLSGIATALIGGALLFSGALLLVLAEIGYALTTPVAFVVTATNGLFGGQEVWSGKPAVAGFTELAGVLLLLARARSISCSLAVA